MNLMEVTIATKSDIDDVLALQDQIYRIDKVHPDSAQILSDLIDANYCDVIVAKEDNKVVGTGVILYLPIPAHGKPYAFLEGMVVDVKHRRKGVGSALTQKAIDLAKSKNCYKIIFTSGMDREEIHNFYEKHGFKKWGYEFRLDL